MHTPDKTPTQRVADGNILEGPYWPEPVRVLSSRVRDRRIELHAVGLHSERYFRDVIDLNDFTQVHVRDQVTSVTFGADPDHFRLAIEAHHIRLAYTSDPHFAVSVSQIQPLPHQLAAVYDYILPHPRIRFMLADDPGAGKTIMAGLALKELKYRRVVDRILIVAPANLIPQWQRELEQKFDETFVAVKRDLLRAFPGPSAWQAHSQCITSVDFAKQDDVMDSLRSVHWDLVIVDEAHKMAAYRYGKKLTKTARYQLGELLSAQSESLLFLTATPHKGDPNNFLLLLQLLDPDLYADTDILRQAVRRDETPIFLRRMKEQMEGFDGKPLFPPRHSETVAYQLSPGERRLYDAVTEYVEDGFQRAFREENRHVQLALLVLQRRLASSLHAIRRSLEKRRDRLNEVYALGQQALQAGDADELDWEEMEDMPEIERWQVEDEALARNTMARDLPELETEVEELSSLIRLAQIAEAAGTERKLEELRAVMEDTGIFRSDEKLLIFTEAKDTLDYLIENLQRWGFRVTQIHGGMSLGDPDDPAPGSRLYAEAQFGDPHGAQVMVATEAAGEGINLQFCHLMVNYDIPWNPNRLSQRMGRIHRYGQDREVYIFNLVAGDTREGQVVVRLLEKLKVMRKELGDTVFDVIDEIAEEESLEQLFRQALARRRSFDEIKAAIDARFDPANAALVRKARLEGLATDHIDLSGVRAREQAAQEHRLMPYHVERFFVEAYRALGQGELERRDDGLWSIDWVRAALRDVPTDLSRRFGETQERYRRFTFDKQATTGDHPPEFVAPGHPLFETVRYQVERQFGPTLREGAAFYDPEGRQGRLWFLRCGVRDGHSEIAGERLFAVFEPVGGQPETWRLPSIWNLKGDKGARRAAETPGPLQYSADAQERVIDWSLSHCVDPYFETLAARRQREAEIKTRYLKRSLNARISASMNKIGQYKRRERDGEDMTLALRQEERRRQEYIDKRDRRLREIALEGHLSRQMPEVIGVAAVLPQEDAQGDGGMRSSAEIEQVAMAVVMQYERQAGRTPEDVSQEDLGFDVRSRGPDDALRRIEVKGRAGMGAVRLSPNEWTQAQQLGETFWLYIVVNCASDPQLWVMQDPAAKLQPDEEVTVTSYLVRKRSWQGIAERRDVDYIA
jgi:hypothetical protein